MRDSKRCCVIAGLLLAFSAPAHAQQKDTTAAEVDALRSDEAAAEALFQEGKRLFQEKRYAEACPKLAESQRLDPATGTLVTLALCHEAAGLLATAWAEFVEVESRARKDGRSDRETLARERAAALRPRLSTLTIVVPPEVASTPGLAITRDGVMVEPSAFGVAAPLDGGTHRLEVTAPGKRPHVADFAVQPEGDSASITIPPLEAAAPPPPAPKIALTPPESRGFGALEWSGMAAAGAGAVTLGVGGYFLASALSKKSDSDADCDDNTCGPRGYELRNDARDRGNVATALGIGGAVLVAAGATLFAVGRAKAKPERPTAGLTFTPIAGQRGLVGVLTGSL